MLRNGLREREKKWGRWRRWLFSAMLIVIGLTIASFRTYVVADDRKSEVTTTADWSRYLPPDALGVFSYSPNAMLHLPSVQPHLEEFNHRANELSLLPGVKGLGVPLDAFESVVLLPYFKMRDHGKPGTGEFSLQLFYLRMKQANQLASFLKHNFKTVEKLHCAHGDYFAIQAPELLGAESLYFMQPDPRTVVVGATKEQVIAWLSEKEKPFPDQPWSKLWPNTTGIATIAYNWKSLKQNEEPFPWSNLLPTTDAQVVCHLDRVEPLSLCVTVSFAKDSDAADWKKRFDDTLATLKGEFGQLLKTPNSKENPSERSAIELLSNCKSEINGNRVTLNTTSATQAGEILEEVSKYICPGVKVEAKEKK
jgi:hypothetical protein